MLTSNLRLPYCPSHFCFLSSASVQLPATQLSVSSFQVFSFLPHSGFLDASFPFSFPGFPRYLIPDLSCIPSRFSYSALLMVSFRSTLIRSRSCSSGEPLLNCFSGADTWLQLSFVYFRFSISLLGLCFFRSILTGVTSQWFDQRTTQLSSCRFPLSSRPDFSCLSSRFLYLAFCLFSFALSCFSPTADLQVIPLCFRFRDFLLQVHFLSSVFHSLPATQPSVSSFPFSSCLSLTATSSVLVFRFRFLRFPHSFLPDLSCILS